MSSPYFDLAALMRSDTLALPFARLLAQIEEAINQAYNDGYQAGIRATEDYYKTEVI